MAKDPERSPLTAEGRAGDAAAPEDGGAHHRGWTRLAVAGAATLALAALAAAGAVAVRGQGPARGAQAVRRGEAEQLVGGPGPFGETAGPAFVPEEAWLGSFPQNGNDPVARLGRPPRLPIPPTNPNCPAGCKGKCCNGGKLCCGKDAVCCGTSCCSHGSICCKASIGLCCAKNTMCCYGKLCCAPGFYCGRSRDLTGAHRFAILENCGSGAQFRRLLDKELYKRDFRRLLASNDSALEELVNSWDPASGTAEGQ